jgi:Domain of unknown function (DUF397)
MNTTAPPDLSAATWRKSTRSSGGGSNCVEIAALPSSIAIRDSKNPEGRKLIVSRAAFVKLAEGIRHGALSCPTVRRRPGRAQIIRISTAIQNGDDASTCWSASRLSPAPVLLQEAAMAQLQVTVTYSLKGEHAERTVLVLLHDVHERQVREQKVMGEIPWEKIPEDVREKFLRDGQHPVAFTLYPVGR